MTATRGDVLRSDDDGVFMVMTEAHSNTDKLFAAKSAVAAYMDDNGWREINMTATIAGLIERGQVTSSWWAQHSTDEHIEETGCGCEEGGWYCQEGDGPTILGYRVVVTESDLVLPADDHG